MNRGGWAGRGMHGIYFWPSCLIFFLICGSIHLGLHVCCFTFSAYFLDLVGTYIMCLVSSETQQGGNDDKEGCFHRIIFVYELVFYVTIRP